jgi:hypothetical protein
MDSAFRANAEKFQRMARHFEMLGMGNPIFFVVQIFLEGNVLYGFAPRAHKMMMVVAARKLIPPFSVAEDYLLDDSRVPHRGKLPIYGRFIGGETIFAKLALDIGRRERKMQ